MKSFDELLALIIQRGVHPVFGDSGEGWAIEQNAEELAQFLVEMQAQGVESVLEIGTGWKAGLSRFLAAELGLDVTTVDVQDYSHAFPGVVYYVGDPDWLAAQLDKQYDLVFIDANHTYANVKADAKRWQGFAKKVIAFHDIAGLRECEGVQQYWQEVSHINNTMPKMGYHAIVAEGEQRSGIGYYLLRMELNNELLEIGVNLEAEISAIKPTPPKKTTSRKPAAKKPTATKKAAAKK